MRRPIGRPTAQAGPERGRTAVLVAATVTPVALAVLLYVPLAALGAAPWRALPALLTALAVYAVCMMRRARTARTVSRRGASH